jgi:signal transduction histidine kinase
LASERRLDDALGHRARAGRAAMSALPTSEAAPARWPLLAWAWRVLRIGVPISVVAAAFISTMFRDPFVRTLIYSLCIGLSIQLLIELGRSVGSAWRLKRDPHDDQAARRWPGWAWMGPWAVLAAVTGYFGGALLADAMQGEHRTRNPFSTDGRALSLILMLSLGFTLSTVYFFHSRGRLAVLQAITEAAKRKAAEAQLKLLQSQLEPHMLFNTLANLRVLIGSDPARAQAMLDRLIAFLRATLAASRSGGWHALADEFARVDDYLALMSVRMGTRLRVQLELPAELCTCPVPALLLQPLVENSVRHGLEPKVDGGRIAVSARRDGEELVLCVRDSGVGLGAATAGAGTQFGLVQVRERLATLHGERASLALRDADDAEGGVLATGRMPVQVAR